MDFTIDFLKYVLLAKGDCLGIVLAYPSSHNHRSEKIGPSSNSTYLSNKAILHFHDYGRKGN